MLRPLALIFPLTFAVIPMGPAAAGAHESLVVRPLGAGATGSGEGRVGAPEPAALSDPASLPGHEIQRLRERQWRSFPDLLVDPRVEWAPRFGARQGWRAPLENLRASAGRATASPRAAAPPQVINLAIIRLDFLRDRDGSASTGNGRFDLSNPGASVPPLDRPPRNRAFYLQHLEALNRYFGAQSYGRVEIRGEVWPRQPGQENLAYSLTDMADFGPWRFGQSIYRAAVHLYRTMLLTADQQAKALGDTIPWHQYDGIVLLHAGSDLQSDLRQDSKHDIPTFAITVADTDRVVFPDSTKRFPPDPDDPLAEYGPIRAAAILPETINQDGFYGTINGVLAHECGHLLFGLADLYNIVNGFPVVGYWSLMDSGNLLGAVVPQPNGEEIYATGLLPPSVDPFQRFFIGDALDFPEVVYDGAPTRLLDSQRNPDVRGVTLTSDEFLLLENRALAKLDTLTLDQDSATRVILGPKVPDRFEYDALLPGGGILAWRVDNSVLTYSTSLRVNPDFGFNTRRGRLGVSLIEADGLEDLGDLGSPFLLGSHRDPFYRSNNPTLSDTTAPSLRPNLGTRPHVRLDFLDEPADTMHFTARRAWQLPGWPVLADFPPGGPQLLAVDADGDPADAGLEVCWAGGDTTGGDANALFVMKRDGRGLFGPSPVLTTLPERPRPLLAAIPQGGGPLGDEGPSLLAVSTFPEGPDLGSPGGRVWLVDASLANPGQAVPGWPPALPSIVTTPPVIAGAMPAPTIFVGCADGFVYALNLDGTVHGVSATPLAGGVRGRLAVAPASGVEVAGGGAASGWIVAAGGARGDVAAFVVDATGSGTGPMALARGWPQHLQNATDFEPDFLWLDFDGRGSAAGSSTGCGTDLPELVVHRANRLWAFCAGGRMLPGWGRAESDTLVTALGAGDPDGDGYPEVLTQSIDSKVAFRNLTGFPSPGWPRCGSPEGVLAENFELTYPDPPRRFPTASPPLALDADGDGRSEIVALNTSGILAALDARGRTPSGWPLATGSGASGSPVAADLDRDGWLELVAPDRFGALFAYALPVPVSPGAAHAWPMIGGDPGRTSALPAARMALTPPPGGSLLVRGSLKAYPNPARRRPVSFAYQLNEPADVEFRILDASGHQVASFRRRGLRTDNLEIWDPADVPAGLYLARISFRTGGREQVEVLPLGLIR